MKKADEMEMHINFKAMRLSWVVVALFLLIWNVVELINTGDMPFLPFILMCLQSTLFFTVKTVLSKKMTAVHSDEE